MDVTGQAFEDMQEQNTRLLQQLREKDEANFKLMSEVSVCHCFISGGRPGALPPLTPIHNHSKQGNGYR